VNKRKPIPKSQAEISQNQIEPYDAKGRPLTHQEQNRGYERSVKGDDVKPFNIGFKDLDEAVLYYFNNVIRPSVVKNGQQITVPVLYGSPERWKAVQQDGFYRDKNGKIQTPLIMFKTTNIEKMRNLGNKLDANNPRNYGVFKKQYSRKNAYDRFSILQNRIPVEEYHGVIIPDWVNITYDCMIFTEYVSQMNKVVEAINFASDSYWGNPQKFRFRAMIDSYSPSVEVSNGSDRMVKTSFSIKLFGHIIPDSVNSSVAKIRKSFSKAAVKFSVETAGSIEVLEAKLRTPERSSGVRFYDTNEGRVINNVNLTGDLQAGVDYVVLGNILDSNTDSNVFNPTTGIITFTDQTLVDLGGDITAGELIVSDFKVYVNGLGVEPSAITSISQGSGDFTVQFNLSELNFSLTADDEIVVMGRDGNKLLIADRNYSVTQNTIDSNQYTSSIDTGSQLVTISGQDLVLPSNVSQSLSVEDFTVYLNGLIVEPSAIDTFVQSGSVLELQFNAELNHPLESDTELVINGRDTEIDASVPDEERDYLLLNNVLEWTSGTDLINPGANTVTFVNHTIATPPAGYPALTVEDFKVFISGIRIEPSAIDSITQVTTNIVIQFNAGLDHTLIEGMEILLIGKVT